MSSGLNPQDPSEEYELTLLGTDHFTLKFTNRASQTVSVYSATRVLVPPPMTFMQKYGMSLLMGAMILIQVGKRRDYDA